MRKTTLPLSLILWFTSFYGYAAVLPAQSQKLTSTERNLPAIAIIIDDIGYSYKLGSQAISLPGAVTYSFLPHTPFAHLLADFAHQQHKEVMLHVPMESIAHDPLDPGGITMEMGYEQVILTLQHDLTAVPHVVGLNNHMGSLLTQHPGHMQWMMQSISDQNLFFVDSFTTENSIVGKIANENWVPNIRRDIFLDTQQDAQAINQQFDLLLKTARKKGIALAIGHPYPQTIKVLQHRLANIETQGYHLVPVSKLIRLNMQRFTTWRAFLSP